MKIIDCLVENKAQIQIAGDYFQPGHNLREIIVSEIEIERKLIKSIESNSFSNTRLSELVAVANHPRKSYFLWLENQLEILPSENEPNPDFAPETSVLMGSLLSVVEQAMFHAFIHNRDGKMDLADCAWHTSGAAMMQLTKFVSMFSAQHAAPVLKDMPSLSVKYETSQALQSDADIAGKCAVLAEEAAANSDDDQIRQYCLTLQSYYAQLSSFNPGSSHPAININPPAFSSFNATLKRFLSD
jgi:bacterioferritin (cytochrome b1)